MRKKVDENDLINWWLEKYFNTTIQEVFEKNPKYKDDNLQFYKDYSVTQEQHDQWEKWAKKYTKKVTGIKGKLFDRSWGFLYLNVSPSIKTNDEKNSKEEE